jgi:PAS domain S-box-containing protein
VWSSGVGCGACVVVAAWAGGRYSVARTAGRDLRRDQPRRRLVVHSRRELARRLEHHAALSLDLIATASFDGYFRQLNPAFSRTLGFSIEELISRPLLEFVHPEDREPTLEAIARQAEEGREILHFQNRYLTKDGSYRWLEWTSRPDPQARELIAVARDITERKRLEALVDEHTEMLERAVRERTADLDAARLETLQRLAKAAEYRDDDTHQHTERVGSTAALIAEQLGMNGEQVTLIRLAAPLHDVGKLAVSDTILLKPGRLTTEEFRLMQEHVTAGAALLAGSSSRVLQLAEVIALTHHERWDGTSYPRRLEREQIPIAGRIVAVADVFDALTHVREQHPGRTVARRVAQSRQQRSGPARLLCKGSALNHHALLSPRRHTHLAIVA